jgi:hypothetical protein
MPLALQYSARTRSNLAIAGGLGVDELELMTLPDKGREGTVVLRSVGGVTGA